MTKKILLFLIAFASITGASARDLSACQKWGLAPNDFSKLTTISYLNTPGTYGEGLRMPVTADMKDYTIEGVSVPVAMPEMKNLHVFVCSDKNFRNVLAEINVPAGTLKKGYNDIAFESAIPMPSQNVYVGYTYTIDKSGASIVVFNTKADEGLYLNLGDSWLDYSPYSMGVSALQVIIGTQNLDEYSVAFHDIEWPNVVCGEGTVRATLRSSSMKSVESVNYSITIGKEKQMGTINFTEPIEEGMNKDVDVDITFATPTTPQKFDAIFSIDAVNGTYNVQPDGPLTTNLNAVSRRVERLSVVEEVTGTRCGFCPRGWVGMEYMRNNFPGKFAGICFHQYNNDDPMANYNYAHLDLVGAPNCAIDRSSGAIDPYNGSGYYPTILGNFADYQRLVPDVEVKSIEAELTTDTKYVVAHAETEFLADAEGYSIAYVLTADGLKAPKGGNAIEWAQTNYFHSMAPESVTKDDLPDLALFCQGGKYGSEYVYLTYNDVMIASSYNAQGKLLTEALPNTVKANEVVKTSYELKIPTTDKLLKALDYDNLFVTVLVIDNKGRIANAGRTRVSIPFDIVGIVAPQRETDVQNSATYDLSGRRISANAKGVSIRRENDGSVRKTIMR